MHNVNVPVLKEVEVCAQKVVVGSRGSELALRQAQLVVAELQKHFPEVDFKIKTIKTAGDKILDLPLPKLRAKVFL